MNRPQKKNRHARPTGQVRFSVSIDN